MGTSALLQVPKCWNLKPCCSLAKKNLIHTFYISQGSSSSVSWEGLLVVTNLESSPGTQQSPLSSELQRMSVFQLIILVLEPSTLLFRFCLNNLVFWSSRRLFSAKKPTKKLCYLPKKQQADKNTCRFAADLFSHRSCWINQRYTKCRLLDGLKHDSKWMLHCPLSAECVLGNCLLTHWSCQCSSTAVT